MDIALNSDSGISSYDVTQPLDVSVNNSELDVKLGAAVRFVASAEPTPGLGVKSNLS